MAERTPEDRPPAFPSPGATEPGDRASARARPSSRANRLGRLPALLGALAALPASLADAWRRGAIWRVAVAEDSMLPAIEPGDWLLLDPTPRAWPRHGAVVVVREPDSDVLAIKRVAARPGDRVRLREGILHLGADEAWVLGDGGGASIDSRRYGPVPLENLVGRAWLRYWPPRRAGRIPRH